MSNKREFDVVIFGATGFTGKLVAEYFQSQYGNNNNVKWAVAGRNESKLNDVKKELGIDVIKCGDKSHHPANPDQLFPHLPIRFFKQLGKYKRHGHHVDGTGQ